MKCIPVILIVSMLLSACDSDIFRFKEYDYDEGKNAELGAKGIETKLELRGRKVYLKREWKLPKTPPRKDSVLQKPTPD